MNHSPARMATGLGVADLCRTVAAVICLAVTAFGGRSVRGAEPSAQQSALGGTRVKANDTPEAFAELERGVHTALETYSNVHRGSGHNSIVSTYLFEQARDIVLEYLGLNGGLVHTDKYAVIFCTPRYEGGTVRA